MSGIWPGFVIGECEKQLFLPGLHFDLTVLGERDLMSTRSNSPDQIVAAIGPS